MSPTDTSVHPDNITKIFRRVLEVDDLTGEENFFEAGGDSLLATRVLSAIAREYGVDLTFDDFVIAPSPQSLASLVGTIRS